MMPSTTSVSFLYVPNLQGEHLVFRVAQSEQSWVPIERDLAQQVNRLCRVESTRGKIFCLVAVLVDWRYGNTLRFNIQQCFEGWF